MLMWLWLWSLFQLMVDWLSRILCVQNKPSQPKQETATCSKAKWSNCHVNNADRNGKLSDSDFKFAKVRLLDNGVEANRMLARQESFDSCNFESYSDRTQGSGTQSRQWPLLEEVRGIREALQRHEDKRLSKEERERRIREWRVIACVTDRVFFIIYVCMNFVGLMVIFWGT